VDSTVPSGTAAKIPDHRLVQNGLDLKGVLSEAVEEQATMTRAPTIEPKGEFVEVVIQMGGTYRALMGAWTRTRPRRLIAAQPRARWTASALAPAFDRHQSRCASVG
jgi:hypothetical protein